jgi:pectin-derived oligosaccharide transport system substrate-binding protein
MRRSRAWAILLTTTAALLLTACGGGESASQDLSDKPVTLRFTWWGSDDRHTRTKQVIDLFQDEHPNITVKGEFKEWNGYWDSLATTVAANDAPDIIQMDELYLSSYAERGALLDLGTATKHLNLANFEPKVLATGAIDKKQYGLPTGVTTYALVVNTDLLAKYKIPVPDDSTWGWDDLKAVGAQVSQASGGKVKGVQSWGFDTGGLNIWARQAGASLYDAKGNVAIPPAVLTSFWAYLSDLAKTGVAPPPSVTVEQAGGGLDLSAMATNTAAFGTWWSSQLPSVSAASGAHLRLLRLPGEAAAPSPAVYLKPSMFWSISSRSKHPAEAALFVDFLANSDKAGKVFLTDRGFPANSTIEKAISGQLSGPDAAVATYIDKLTPGQPPTPTPKGASNIEAILKRHTEQVLFGRMTPQKAATSFIAELQAEIDAA